MEAVKRRHSPTSESPLIKMLSKSPSSANMPKIHARCYFVYSKRDKRHALPIPPKLSPRKIVVHGKLEGCP